jgi:hypothetical protein
MYIYLLHTLSSIIPLSAEIFILIHHILIHHNYYVGIFIQVNMNICRYVNIHRHKNVHIYIYYTPYHQSFLQVPKYLF